MTKLTKFDKDEYVSEFGNMLHVIILEDGTVYQSDQFIPDMVDLISRNNSIPTSMVMEMCPYTKHIDVVSWMCITAGVACVTSTGIWFYALTENQIESLQKLKYAQLYLGEVPYQYCN